MSPFDSFTRFFEPSVEICRPAVTFLKIFQVFQSCRQMGILGQNEIVKVFGTSAELSTVEAHRQTFGATLCHDDCQYIVIRLNPKKNYPFVAEPIGSCLLCLLINLALFVTHYINWSHKILKGMHLWFAGRIV
jgi:hypothetical protein